MTRKDNRWKRDPNRKLKAFNTPSAPVPMHGGKPAKDRWLETHKEYLRWRKTDGFRRWRHKQFLKQGGTCYYCDNPIFGGVRENVDHVIPKVAGGSNHPSNLVLACARCNKEKHTTYLSRVEKERLATKNKKKKGTYLKNREYYSTEGDIGRALGAMFND